MVMLILPLSLVKDRDIAAPIRRDPHAMSVFLISLKPPNYQNSAVFAGLDRNPPPIKLLFLVQLALIHHLYFVPDICRVIKQLDPPAGESATIVDVVSGRWAVGQLEFDFFER